MFHSGVAESRATTSGKMRYYQSGPVLSLKLNRFEMFYMEPLLLSKI